MELRTSLIAEMLYFLQFLSMKLATINPRMEYRANDILSTENVLYLMSSICQQSNNCKQNKTKRNNCRVNETLVAREMEFVRDGTYVRLNGHLKTFQGEKQLLVFSVRPIMDFNEVTFHYIECIHFYSQNSESQDNKSVMLLSRLTPHFKVDQTQSNTIEPPVC
ncbi:unnamed protein product [Arabidopsis thaliana]|uniref:Uncharacterized protein n=1 Tax=Arabidopsis thaliana TaxID=3702 RepID=A0A654FP15_ARATH|nr:unnamed protein product [Arabidopsis thaliana]